MVYIIVPLPLEKYMVSKASKPPFIKINMFDYSDS